MRALLIILLFIAPLQASAQLIKKVLVIGIDGVRTDALLAANTPNIDYLISTGIFSPDALNTDITISGPGWSANLCGVWSNKHLVTSNNFNGNNYAQYPPVIKYIEDYNNNLNTASICNWGPINDWIVADHADFKLNVGTDAQVSAQAVSYISNNDPDFLFLHFDDPDAAGHGFGFSPSVPQYVSSIEGADQNIGPILNAIQQRPTYSDEDWLIIVTTDHGGIGTSHGGNTIEEQKVPFIVSGNNVIPSVVNKQTTILPPPVDCLSNPLELHFDGSDDFVQVPADPLFDFGSTQDFTIECRVRTDISADVSIVGNKNWSSGFNKGFVFSFKYPSGPEWKVNIGDGSQRADLNTGGLIANNEWHTLSVSFDRDGMMKMYENGVLIDQTDISFIGDINTNQGLFFGADINSAFDFSGVIAEVRVWNKVIGPTQIQNWHCASITNSHPDVANLIGYWRMNSDSGSSITRDESGNGNHGNLNGAIWQTPQPIEIDDYSGTPRLVDVPMTAIFHLCIPVESAWNLDGISWIPECFPVLPVEFHSFEAKKTGSNAVQLKWIMSEELNNSGFDIEKSEDGIKWKRIGFLQSNSKGSLKNEYRFMDFNPNYGSNYYRIKSIDSQGFTQYTNVELVQFKKNQAIAEFYPNPASGELNLEIQQGFQGEAIIINSSGAVVWNQKFNTYPAKEFFKIKFDAPGAYFLKTIADDHVLVHKLLIID